MGCVLRNGEKKKWVYFRVVENERGERVIATVYSKKHAGIVVFLLKLIVQYFGLGVKRGT